MRTTLAACIIASFIGLIVGGDDDEGGPEETTMKEDRGNRMSSAIRLSSCRDPFAPQSFTEMEA